MSNSLKMMGATVAAVGVLVALLKWGGNKPSGPEQGTSLVLYCAAGMKPPVERIAKQYEAEYGVHIQLQYGGSGTLLSNLQVDELAELLGLGDLLDRKPAGLSGGESQRVALGRALSASPDILCLDEPLSALDDETREEMFALPKRVKQETGVTTLHITHNMSETNTLADMLLRMEGGRMAQTDNGD